MLQQRVLTLARSAPLTTALAVGAGWLVAALAIAQAWCLSVTIESAFLNKAGLDTVAGWLFAAAVLIVVRGAATAVAEVAAAAGSRRIRARLRLDLARAVMRRGLTFSTTTQSGELAQTLTDGVDALDAFFSQYLPQIAQTALIPLTIGLVVVTQDPLTALVLALTAPLVPVFMILVGYAAQALTRRQFALLGQLGGHFLDVLQGLTTLKLLGRGAAQAVVLARYSARYRSATMAVLRLAFLSALVLELLTTLSTAVIAVEIGLRLINGALTFQTALFALILTPDFYLPLRLLGQRYHAAASGLGAAERLFALLDEPDPPPVVNTPPPAGGLQVTNLGVIYPDGRPALADVSFSAPPGSVIAVIGANGSGKSTLLRAIAGLQRPSQGSLGFRTGSLFVGAAWPEQVAYLPQRPHVFADTLGANIALARPAASAVEIRAAAADAGLTGFLKQLPNGLDTQLSELGRNLSGGQAQRIALARVCLQVAPLVVLDEPEQSLDSLLTARLVSLVRAWKGARTVVLAAHRRVLAEGADLVLVLEHGRLVLSGPPEIVLPQCPWLDDAMVPLEAEVAPSVEAPPSASPEVSGPGSGNLTALSRLWILAQTEWRRMTLALLLAALTIAANVALMTTSAYLIAAAALQPPLTALSLAIVGTRAFGLARGVLRYLERLAAHDVSLRLLTRLRVWFYTALEPLWPARLVRAHTGDLVTRAVADIDTLQDAYVRLWAPPAAAVLLAAAGTISLIQIDPALAMIAFLGAAAVAVGLPAWGLFTSHAPGAAMIASRSELQQSIVDGVQGQTDLLACNQSEAWMARVVAAQGRANQAQRRLTTLAAVQSGLTTILTHLTVLGVLARGVALAQAGRLDGVWLAPLALGTLAAFEAFVPLPAAAAALGAILAAARRVFAIVAPERRQPPAQAEPGIPAQPDDRGHAPALGLEIRDLTFQYPGQSRPALESVSLSLKPGERLALVGPSGSGKSTVAALLTRLWQPPPGALWVDGRDAVDLTPDELRRQISVLEQNPHVFNASLRENLLLADPIAPPDLLWSALARVGLKDFVTGLPAGLETVIGERGLGLSGGQRQRLALARLLLRPGRLIIADEPVSHLDPAGADSILADLFAAAAGRSLIVISHDRLRPNDYASVVHLQSGRVQFIWRPERAAPPIA
ncbi:MAG: thiol reductant ABC exporter subunit CydD [Anaerolineales bacterium]|nr:thiol reductant ABC exporter subunit CydD [Anaerolineales bacterium]